VNQSEADLGVALCLTIGIVGYYFFRNLMEWARED
jgi:hypothetical protein